LLLFISSHLGTYDFDSRNFNVTFNPGDVTKLLNVSVYIDYIVEYNETFLIAISLPHSLNLRIKVDDKNFVEGIIIDSTGKNLCIHKILSLCNSLNLHVNMLSCKFYLWLHCFVVIASISKNPDNFTVVYQGTTVTLSCKATASGPITYQWRRSSGRIIGSKTIGVNTPTLTIPSVTQDDEDEYYCTASYGIYVNGTSHVAESERAKVVVFGKEVCMGYYYYAYL